MVAIISAAGLALTAVAAFAALKLAIAGLQWRLRRH